MSECLHVAGFLDAFPADGTSMAGVGFHGFAHAACLTIAPSHPTPQLNTDFNRDRAGPAVKPHGWIHAT